MAHESNIWSMDWHPFGHILTTGSNDHNTRFWARHRPGDTAKDTNIIHLKHSSEEQPSSQYSSNQNSSYHPQQNAPIPGFSNGSATSRAPDSNFVPGFERIGGIPGMRVMEDGYDFGDLKSDHHNDRGGRRSGTHESRYHDDRRDNKRWRWFFCILFNQ